MLSLRNIGLSFGSFEVLKAIDFDVSKGELVTLLGPSGSGKSTLLKVISGFVSPSYGQLYIDGEDVTTEPPEARDTSLCFQSYALFPHLTVHENLAFGLKQKGLASKERDHQVLALAEQLSLVEQLNKLPNALSGGQQQRVALGRALAMKPKVILFDEPLSNLDAKLRESVRAEIRRIQQAYNLTAIYVTHDQSEALAISDRILVINEGRAEQLSTPETLYHQPKSMFVADFIGGANIFPETQIQPFDEHHRKLNLPFGEVVALLANSEIGDSTRTCWRPESIKIGYGEQNCFEGVIIERAFQGAFTEYVILCNDTKLRCISPNSQYDIGEKIQWHVDPSNVISLGRTS